MRSQTSLLKWLAPAVLLAAGPAAKLQAQAALKDAYKDDFRIGAALNPAQFTGRDERGAALIKAQFNAISPENVLKWGLVHPRPDEYRFEPADAYVAFGEQNHMFVVGHCLVWHNQTPAWVFQDGEGKPLERQALLDRMRGHILTVAGRYKGRIRGWDVVNEALNDDGTLRLTPWMKIIGEDYIAKAFEYAHEADPGAELYYNDYSLENPAKRRGAVELIRKLKARGIPVAAVGLQGHDRMDWPSLEQQDATIAEFAALGVKVNITELDIDVLPSARRQPTADVSATSAGGADSNPYTAGLPDSVQQALAARYAALFGVFLKHRGDITRVTFWGVHDGSSWLNNFPVRGRTNYPLLFDRNYRPKPAFDAVIQAAREAAAAQPPVKLPDLYHDEMYGDPPYLTEPGWRPLLNGADLSGWRGETGRPEGWVAAKAVNWRRIFGPNSLVVRKEPGSRIVCGQNGKSNLVTEEKFGDFELYLEFLLARGSNSGVYLHGLYEVQIFDSYDHLGALMPGDCGGIYEGPEGQPGFPPLRNACAPPGQWQSMSIWFQAPRFDAAGAKRANARVLRVMLNGQPVQENVEVPGPTRGAMAIPEAPRNPIRLQGDHTVAAFRSIYIRPLP